jgi:hypothetical protein
MDPTSYLIENLLTGFDLGHWNRVDREIGSRLNDVCGKLFCLAVWSRHLTKRSLDTWNAVESLFQSFHSIGFREVDGRFPFDRGETCGFR